MVTHYIVSVGVESPLETNTEALTNEIMSQLGCSKTARSEPHFGKQLPAWMYAGNSKESSVGLAEQLRAKLYVSLRKELNVLVFAASGFHVAHTPGSMLKMPKE